MIFCYLGGISNWNEYYEVGACTRSMLCVSGTEGDYFAVVGAGGAAVAVAVVAASSMSLAKALPMPLYRFPFIDLPAQGLF